MLKAGFGRLDVTPPLGSHLAGYFHMRFARMLWDPIELNALAVQNDAQTVLIVTMDAEAISVRVAEHLRELIEEGTGVPAGNILIAALHQHTSVELGEHGDNVLKDRAYLHLLYRKFVDVAQMAMADLSPAKMGSAVQATREPISFIRRFLMKDGSFGDSCFCPAEAYAACLGKADNDVRLVRFSREGGRDIALVNFATHPDVIAKDCFTADWPGFVRRFVEREQTAHCLTLTGFEGDTNHINVFLQKEQRGRGYAHSEKMGRIIADAVNAAWESVRFDEDEGVHAELCDVFVRTNLNGMEHFEECRAFTKRYHAGQTKEQYTPSGIIYYMASVIASLPERPAILRVPLTLLSFGNVALVGFPGEPFTSYMYALREKVPQKLLLTACMANGSVGYFPDKLAFSQGSYEVLTSPFTDELEDKLLQGMGEMLDKIK